MSTFTNNNVASGDVVRASDHNTQGANIASVVNGNIEADNLAANAVTTAKIADASVTNAKFNTAAGELGGAWDTWTPTITGFSANPTNSVYRYTQVGKTVTALIRQGANGTSNSTTFTVTLPVAASAATNTIAVLFGAGVNNSAGLASPCMVVINASAPTIATMYTDAANTGWAASGGKRITVTLVYEAA